MTKFCVWVDIQDLITYATFGDDRLRGLGMASGQISHFPIDLRHRPYNALAPPCECVMYVSDLPDICTNVTDLYLLADDAKICKYIRNGEDQAELQTTLNKLQKWSDTGYFN